MVSAVVLRLAERARALQFGINLLLNLFNGEQTTRMNATDHFSGKQYTLN
jgi:hypothetical protein